jgi:photosystem II stability/assembly factor-like uncharacterized protein
MSAIRRKPLLALLATVSALAGVVGVCVASQAQASRDRPPRIVSIRLSPTHPTRLDIVAVNVTARDPDGTRVHLAYQWLVNGSVVRGATGSSFRLRSHAVHKGDHVRVRVAASDGQLSVAERSDPVTVADAPPVIVGVNLSPAQPNADQIVSASPSSVTDPDGDPTSTTCVWTLGNAQLGGDACSLDLHQVEAVKGQTLSVTLTTSDGRLSDSAQATTTLVNTAPQISAVSIGQSSPGTADTVHAAVDAVDADGDPLALSYQWLLNGSPISGATSSALDLSLPGNGDRGNQLAVSVTADDGTSQVAATTDPVAIVNSAPSVVQAQINYDAQSATASVESVSHDPDSDATTTHVRWSVNGEDAGTQTTLDVVGAGAHVGDEIEARVWATDSHAADSAWVSATPVTAGSGIPQAPPLNSWQPIAVGYDDIESIAPVASDTQQIYVAGLGFWHSSDAGASFNLAASPNCLPIAVAYDAKSPATVYLGCQSAGVVRSTDHGATWQSLTITDPFTQSPPTIYAIAVDPVDSNIVFAGAWGTGSSPNIYRSFDGGDSWQPVDTASGRTLSIAIDPADDQHVVLGTPNGARVSTDGGDTWSGPFGPGAMKIAFDQTVPSTLWAIRYDAPAASVLESGDGGTTWSALTGSPTNLTAIAVAPGVLDVGGKNGVSQTTDAGTTWQTTKLVTSSTMLSSVAVDPADSRRVYVGWEDGGGLWRLTFTPDMTQGDSYYNIVGLEGITNITATTATFHATLAPLLSSDHGWVVWDWGVGSPQGSSLIIPFTGNGGTQHVSTPVLGLTPNTTYSLELGGAVNGISGIGYAGGPYDVTFTTPPA